MSGGDEANLLEQYLQHSAGEVAHLSDTETALLQKINLGIAQEIWQQYHKLIEKRRAEMLTPAEQKTLIEITDQIERANVRRISALVELAGYWQVSLDQLMSKFLPRM